jgi:hypothetical protein
MGVPLSCRYCPFGKPTQYEIKIEMLNPEPIGMFDPATHGYLKRYQNTFGIHFDSFTFSEISTYLCSECFHERFNGERWKDYRQKFERAGKIYVLSVEYNERGYRENRKRNEYDDYEAT